MWNNFIKVNGNIHYVLSGHEICSPTSAYSFDINNSGTSVHQLFFNHQCDANGGNGFLIIMTFSQQTQKINIKTYSPYLNTFDLSGEYMLSSITNAVDKFPLLLNFILEQNFPNPFNPSTTLRYGLPMNSRVALRVYNILGQQVAELVNSEQSAGWYRVSWQANVASGVYIYRLEAVSTSDPTKRFVDVKKMVLMR
jgi:hypothetical protein